MIRPRGPGRWQVVVYAGRTATGKERRIRKTIRGPKRDARKLERELSGAVAGAAPNAGETTLAALIDRWLAHAGPDLAARTADGYARTIDRHVRPTLGALPLEAITAATLDHYYDGLRATLSPKTIRNVHAMIRRALGQAVAWGLLTSNPAADATPPRLVTPDIHPPDPADVIRLLRRALADTPDLGTFLWLAATTGARRGELVALKWADLDPSAGTLLIERAVVALGGRTIVKDTKTHQARRIALGAPTLELLEAHRHRGTGEGWMFPSPADPSRPWHPDTVSAAYRRAVKRAGLETRLHDLRHFVATQALAAGVPVRTVSGRLGHRNPATTHNVYAHFLEASDQVLATTLDELLA